MIKSADFMALVGQFFRFSLVGGLAAATHYMVAMWAYPAFSLPIANIFGFLLAFWVSFFGHFYFSFRQGGAWSWAVLLQFLAVAISGFLINQAVILFLLKYSHLPAAIMLGIAIIISALATFLLSKILVFKSPPP